MIKLKDISLEQSVVIFKFCGFLQEFMLRFHIEHFVLALSILEHFL